MDSTERIARMLAALAPRSPRMERIQAATGQRWTVEDIVHLLSFVELTEARLLLRICYVDEVDYFHDLIKLLNDEQTGIIHRMATRYDWTQRHKYWPGLIQRMSEIAVLEARRKALCHVCEGHGWVLVEAETRPHRETCKTCIGTGMGVISGAQRAGLANLKPHIWLRHWVGPYGEVRKAIMALESDGLYQMVRASR